MTIDLDKLQEIMGVKSGRPLGTPPEPTVNPTSNNLHGAVFAASETDADKAAKDKKLADRLNVPASMLPKDAEARAIRAENNPEILRMESPATAKHLEVPGNAQVVGKDIGKNREFEAKFSTFGQEQGNRATDLAVSLVGKGLFSLFDAGVGINSFLTGGYWGKMMEEAGYNAEAVHAALDTLMSPEALKEQALVQRQEGFVNTMDASIAAPWTIANTVTEFLIPMGTVAKGGKAVLESRRLAPLTAKETALVGGASEGVLTGGLMTEEVRRGNKDRLITFKQQLAVGAAAVGTSALGVGFGMIARKFGFADINTFMASGNKFDDIIRAADMPIGRTTLRLTASTFSNSLEELTQEAQEQVFQNIAEGKPWNQGVPEAAALGMTAGTGHAAAVNTAIAVKTAVGSNARKENAKNAEILKAHENRAIMGDLSKLAADHPQRERSYKQFTEFVQFVTEEGERPQEVFIDAEIVQDAFNQQGVTAEEIQEKMPDLAEQLKVGLATNSEVKISMEDYFTHLAGTPIENRLLDNLRVTEDGMTFLESKDVLRDQIGNFAKDIENLVAEKTPLLTRDEFNAQPPEYVTRAELAPAKKEDELGQPAKADDKKATTPPDKKSEKTTQLKTYEDYLTDNNTTAGFEAEGESVRQTLVNRMNIMGRFTPEENELQSIPMVEWYKQQARLSGRTPLAMLEKFDLAFSRNGKKSELGQPSTYKGHRIDSGGLQGHSMGDTYPMSVIGRGDNTYQTFNAITQEYGLRRDTMEEALQDMPVRPATLSDFTKDNIESILDKDGWAMMSAYKKGNTKEQNEAADKKLEEELQGLRRKYVRTEGVYEGSSEPSFLIFNMAEDIAVGIGQRYGQESVLTKTGLLYSDGRVQRATKVTEVKGTKKDHTYIPETDTRFSITFAKESAVTKEGVHFSKEQRPSLDGRFAGTGIPGSERGRLADSKDKRIKQRVDFYVDVGSGITPESGLGAARHDVRLNNLYDASVDAEGLLVPDINKDKESNDFETAVLDAGYDGYFTSQGDQGRVVMMGDASEIAVPDSVQELGQAQPDVQPFNNRDAAIHPTEQGIKNFWSWFKGSKVVDHLGRPMVVYHGTKKDFDVFRTKGTQGGAHFGTIAQSNAIVNAMSDSAFGPQFVSEDDGRNIQPVYLSIKNPLRLEDRGGFTLDDIIDQLIQLKVMTNDHGLDLLQARDEGVAETSFSVAEADAIDNLHDFLESQGYDGVVYLNRVEGVDASALMTANMGIKDNMFKHMYPDAQDSYIIFNDTQVKSAIGNIGTFSPRERSTLAQSTQIRKGNETLKKYGLSPGQMYNTREVAAALESRQREKYGHITDHSDESMKSIARWMAEEVSFEAGQEDNAVGWYTEKYQNALNNMAKKYPELKNEKDARDTFTLFLAITSDGARVSLNVALADKIYSEYRQSGKINLRVAKAKASVSGNLKRVEELFKEKGVAGTHTYLMEQDTLANLRKEARARGGSVQSGYLGFTILPRAALELGPKLGAFYANLMGAHEYLTMDRWWSRTFNRYRGTLLTAPTKTSMERFRKLIGSDELTDDETIAATIQYQQAYKSRGFKNGTEIEKAANTIYKASVGLQDTPFNGSDRDFMRKAVLRAQKLLKGRGHDLSVADIQAALWYYEKKLYGELGTRQTAVTSFEEATQDFIRGVETQDVDPGATPFVSELSQPKRAGFSPSELTINMLDASDKSSMGHEASHFYLHALGIMASESQSDQQLKDDFSTTMDWFGLPEDPAVWNNMSLAEQEPFHEQWAQSWELYMLEGKSPTIEMQPVFARFRQWMMGVYKSIKQFHEINNQAHLLNDDMRAVFDRRIASDEAIRNAEKAMSYAPLFTNAVEAGMTDEQYAEYLELHGRATEEAMNDLGSRTVRDIKWASGARLKALKELQKEADEIRERLTVDITKVVWNIKVNRARKLLMNGRFTNDEGVEVELHMKLNAQEVKDLGVSSNKLRNMVEGEGIGIDEAATMLGYKSGSLLVEELISAPTPQKQIKDMVDAEMMEGHAEFANVKAIQVAAEASIHNELRARVMATDLHALNKKAGTPSSLNKAAKQAAEQSINARKVRDIHPHQYERAEAKANAEALKQVAKNPKQAITAQQAGLLNNRLAIAAQSAKGEIEAALKYIQKFQKKTTRKAVGDKQMEQIDKLLASFNFKRGETLKSIDQVKALSAWIAEQEAMGFEPIIDAELMEHLRRQSYKELTMSQLRELVSTIKQIEHVGRIHRTLLTSEDNVRFGEAMKRANASLIRHAKKVVDQKGTPNDALSSFTSWVREGLAAHRKFASLIRQMDGGEDGGVLWELLLRPMNTAGDLEARMKAEATEALGVLFDRLPKEDFGNNIHARSTLVPGTKISMTHEQRMMFAMNWGNFGNRQRLMDGGLAGHGILNMQEAEAILDTLTEVEWNFIQNTLDYIGSYRERIGALEKELTGVTPEWVEPAPMITKFGVFRGGYFPAKYDSKLSSRSQSLEAAANLRLGMKAAFNAAATRSGHVQERAEAVIGRPMSLSYNVIAQHVSEVTHRLAWQPWLLDASRILNSLDETIRTHYGVEVLNALNDTKKSIAEGDVPATTFWEKSINHVRIGSTVVGMGWRITTALIQPSGLAQSMFRVGAKHMAVGMGQYLKNPLAAGRFANAQSNLMRDRGQTMQREISEILNKIRSGNDKLSWMMGSYFMMIAKTQRMVDIPTWLGAYEKALDTDEYSASKNETERKAMEKRAVALADSAVIDSQSGGMIKDLAQVQRGGPLQKMWTNFYSYFSATYNLNAEAIARTEFSKPMHVARLAGDLVTLNFLPVVFSVILRNSLRSDCKWDDMECLGRALADEQISYMMGQMIGLRDVAPAVIAATGGDAYSYSGTPGSRIFSELHKLGKQTGQGEFDKTLVKSLANVGGILLHLPTGQVTSSLDGIIALEQGEAGNRNPLQAFITGPEYKPKKR